VFNKIVLTGFQPEKLSDGAIPFGQLKSQARRASHRVPSCDDEVGPVIRFDYRGQIFERKLTRREMVFGVKAPDDNSGGGFAGLVIWRDGQDELPSEVVIEMARARMTGAGEWVIQFVREVVKAANWKELTPEGLTMDEAFELALEYAQEAYPKASKTRKEAFAGSVVQLMTGWLYGGGGSGPTCRQHAAARFYRAGEKLYSFDEAVQLLLKGDGPIFGFITSLHRECAEQEACFGDDPEDVVELKTTI